MKPPVEWGFSVKTNPGHIPQPPPPGHGVKSCHIPRDDQLDEVQQLLLPLAGGTGLVAPPRACAASERNTISTIQSWHPGGLRAPPPTSLL